MRNTNSRFPISLVILSVISVLVANRAIAEELQTAVRNFDFTYAADIEGVEPGAKVRIWAPIPPSNQSQKINSVEAVFPAPARETSDREYGNRMFYVELTQPDSDASEKEAEVKPIKLQVRYDVTRHTVHGLAVNDPVKADAEDLKKFLRPNRMVPLSGKPKHLIDHLEFAKSDIEIARELYDLVYSHMDYDKSKPGYGNGDVVWACDSKTGNCTDFHSVFISFCRIKNIPAQFQIGFPIPAERGSGTIGGYHCWARLYDDEKGWIPVDISEADKHPDRKEFYFSNLDENRIEFSTGRDIVLEPKQSGEPLNYFVYPYVEVDDKPWPREQITWTFSFEDKS